MMPVDRAHFKPPSEGFWSKLFDTPLGDLLHGRVTGSASVGRIIAKAKLAEPLADAIWRCVQSSRLERSRRLSLAAELVSWSVRQLADGRTADDLTVEISERAALVELIDSGKAASATTARRLPQELCEAIRQVAIRVRGKARRREVALALYEHCALEMNNGIGAGQFIERFGDGDVLAPLVSRTRLRPIILEASLPVELLRIVRRVAAGTRLWKAEQDDVAGELCDHFADGLTAGRTSQELVGAFGTPTVAARLIRRAKLRNRPAAWHIWHRSMQATLAACVMVILLWSWLIYRFHSARPGAVPDHIAEWDEKTTTIPVSDRAWPLYREGLEKIDRLQIMQRKDWQQLEGALDTGPRHKHWPEALEFLHHNQDILALFLEATERRELGYVYRDPANDSWLRNQRGQSAEESYPRDGYDLAIILPHIQDMRLARLLIGAGAHEALAERDATRALRLLRARLRMVDQFWHASEFGVVDVIALSNLRGVAAVVARSLAEQPRLFGDGELKDLAHELAGVCDGNPRVRFDGDRAMYGDWIARSYSDDGQGHGRFTAGGFKAVCKELSFEGSSPRGALPGWEWLGPQLADPTTGALAFELAGAGLAAVVAGRQEMLAKCNELMNLRAGELERPYWERPTTSTYGTELGRLLATPSLTRRFSPLLAIMNPIVSASQLRETNDYSMRAVAERDAVLVAIALQLYHRREGTWPASLNQIVPGLLPRVPVDQFDGKPLRYRLIEGRPNVYSVGPNRQDDGGAFPADGTSGWKALTGDWRLFPPAEETEE
jgi:hypothetical protein